MSGQEEDQSDKEDTGPVLPAVPALRRESPGQSLTGGNTGTNWPQMRRLFLSAWGFVLYFDRKKKPSQRKL